MTASEGLQFFQFLITFLPIHCHFLSTSQVSTSVGGIIPHWTRLHPQPTVQMARVSKVDLEYRKQRSDESSP